MGKNVQKLICGLLCLFTVCSVAGCKYETSAPESSHKNSVGTSYSDSKEGISNSAESENSQDGTSSSEETSDNGDSSDSSTETSDGDSSEENSGNGWEDVEPPILPGTDLVLEDVDAFGHKIAYYSDGTWIDLGRVEPLDFTPRAAASRYGYTQLRLEENAAGKQNFYNKLFDAALAFEKTGGDVSSEAVQGGSCYPIAKIDCSDYGISYETQQAVWRTFRQDCPEFYFISTQFCNAGDEFWLCIDGEYARAEDRAALRTAIENAALECDAYLNGNMSETEIALTINDYLTANVTYSYEEDGVTPSEEVWAHNLVGWATMGAGVCETYAESYAYLCDLFGLECWTVSGRDLQSGVGHEWNILQLGGEWYNVDVTWNDEYERSAPQVLSRQWFGMSASQFALTHQADLATGVALQYQVPLPTLSETKLSPVRLEENGVWGTISPTIDQAMEKMVNEGSRYEIILYPDTNAQAKSGKVIYPDGASFTKTKIPKTAGVTISAKRYKTGEYTYIPAMLNAPASVSLQGDLTLKDLTWVGGNIHALDGNLILTDGVDLQLDSLTGAVVRVEANTGYAVLNCALQLTQMDVASGIARVNGSADVQLLNMGKDAALHHLTADNLTVGTVISEEGAMLYTTGKTSTSVVTVGTVVAHSPFALRVDFVGVSGYPTLKLTGAINGEMNLILGGSVNAVIANVTADVNTDALRVYVVQGNTAYQKPYTKDADGNLTVNA